ncbi:MAG: type IV pilin [Porticoccaceae bacterium]|nr:MAG: type IV pilin [Porticoccaceae bacterium]
MAAGAVRGRGFTLLEVLIALAVVAILAAVAWPSYREQVRAGRRAEAQGVLLEAAQYLERFYTENLRYDRDGAGNPVALPAALSRSPREGSRTFYQVAIASVSAGAYVLRATPVGDQAGDGFLEYTSAGERRWDRDGNGAIGDDERCWQRSC